jgi:hypothetical protein
MRTGERPFFCMACDDPMLILTLYHGQSAVFWRLTFTRFYVRMAAIARKIYLNKNSGVGQLAKVTPTRLAVAHPIVFPLLFVVLSLFYQAFGSNERRGAKVIFDVPSDTTLVSRSQLETYSPSQPNRFLGASRSPIRKVSSVLNNQ